MPREHAPEHEWEPFSVGELLEETIALLDVGAPGRDVVLSTIVSPRMPPLVLGHRLRLRQTIGTLVGNAIRHAPASSEVVVAASMRKASDTRILGIFEVSDDGAGVPEHLERALFDPRPDPQAIIPGDRLELDLPTVMCLVQQMDGRLSFASAPGIGCTFSFQLPLDLVGQDEPTSPATGERSS